MSGEQLRAENEKLRDIIGLVIAWLDRMEFIDEADAIEVKKQLEQALKKGGK